MNGLHNQIVCTDGFTMSVQASLYHYCTPRINDAEVYARLEVGFPSTEEELLIPYIDDFDDPDPTEAVYGWVPCRIIWEVIEKHGGLISGDLPPMFPPGGAEE